MSYLPRLSTLALAVTACSTPLAYAADDDVELNDVVVTASGHEQQVKNAPASISVIDREALENKHYRDITDALKDVPGVMVTGGGSSQDISLRGMGSKYTLILVDGKRQGSRETRPNSDGPGIEQGWLPPLSAIERIEVIRGPMSSLYGSDALGGVINVITRKVAKEWNGSVTAETTIQEDSDSGDINQTRFYVGGPLKDDVLGLEVYGQYSQRNEDEIENGYNDQSMRNGTAKLTWTPTDRQTLDFEAGVNKQERTTNPGKSSAASNTRSETGYIRRHYAVTHQGRWDFGTSDSYVQREEIDNPSRDMAYESTVFNSQTVMPLGAHILTLGGQYEKQELTDGGNEAGDLDELTRWQWALFLEDEWLLTEDFSLTGGARLNKDENYGTHWSPRLYGVWNVAPEWTVKGGVTSGYRAPDLRQSSPGWGQATGGRNGNAVILGNPDLKPEESLSHELGVIWDNQQGTQAGLTVFHTDFEDKITEERICDQSAGDASCLYDGHDYDFISERYNVDEVTMQGVEATLTLPLGMDYSLSANYTYTDSEQKSGQYEGKPLNNLPKHMANATLNWQPEGPLSAWTRVNYRGRTSEGTGHRGVEEKIPSYTFVDVGTAYRLTESATLFGGVYNILDKDVNYEDFQKVLDGRRYNAGIRVEF
ncbi:ligand-gated channel protein [Chromohalobacter beijerinckii]|uniref:Ligand-gated channel protein n=1 Tax=Chromohalobacter beijerinckii TaxID=86179 RepID=A0ABV8XHY5_9GAMM|nr:ligand-gated channel protein [Chromohalobacter beijerinckii]MCK0765028.1 ligand-gated channel protein [Chromohalobacter beijerinckii]